MSRSNPHSFPYMPGLDGLRALAVLSVIAYHLNLPFTTGGFLGVTVFFVLSGYLITSLLVWEYDTTNSIDLKHFWIRRAKRLLPAMFLLLAVLNVLIPLIRPELITTLHGDSIAGIFYYSNWHYIFQHVSYFESFGTTSLLTHFWSLAIEEQFYIVWAIVFFICFVTFKKREKVLKWTLIATGLSILAMIVLYKPSLDPSRVYYGTDTRLFSLLIGASLALIFPSHQLSDIPDKKRKWTFEIIGFAGLLVYVIMMMTTNQYQPFIYRGGMVLVSITTALLVLSIALPSSTLLRSMLSVKPLKWIGERSYGIYLWHYPIITLFNSKVNTIQPHYWKALGEFVLILVLASLSYKYVEQPIRKGSFPFPKKQAFASLAAVCVALLAVNTFITPPKHTTEVVKNQIMTKEALAESKQKAVPTEGDGKAPSITAIGDSVLINPSPYLKDEYPSMVIDAKVGRQMWHVNDTVTQLKANKQLGDIVVIELGSNGAFPEDNLTDALKTIGKERKVFLVNTPVPKPWGPIVNKTLKNVAKKYNNTTVLDWHSLSSKHSEYFIADGVHLKPKGAQAFADMIDKAIEKTTSSYKVKK